VLTESDHDRIDARWLTESGHSGLLIAVLGEVTERDRPSLTRMRHSAAGAMAVVLDVPAWTRGGAAGGSAGASLGASTGQSVAWLTSNGWRAVDAGPQDSVPSVWQELGAAARAGRPRTFSDETPGRAPENVS
jgi:hypothetical protein